MSKEGKYIGYARVSRDDQNLDLQFKALREFGIEDKNIFSEHISTRRDRRPQFELALKRCRAGDTLVVWKLDRFGRDMEQIIKNVSAMAARGVKIKSLTEHLDNSTPIGNFTYHIMAAQAQLERDMTSERTKAGIDVAKDRGTWRSRPTSFSEDQWEHVGRLVRDPANKFVNNAAIAKEAGVKTYMVATYRKELEAGTTYRERFPTGDKQIAKTDKS